MALTDKLTAIAAGFRSSRGTTEKLSLEEMAVLASVPIQGGSSEPFCVVSVTEGLLTDAMVETVVNIAAGVFITAEKYYTHFLYNGVRLPRIPEDVLAQYPYCFIRNNTTSGYYEMYCSVSPYYYSSSDAQIQFADSTARQRYRIAIASAETATAWEGNGTSTANVNIDSTKPVLWASLDIPNGSATETDIYFAGSEPIPTE